MNSPRVLRSQRYLYVILLLVLVAAFTFLIVNASYTQPNEKTIREITFYKMTGPLQVFSLEDKQARIDDLTWDLADTFRTKEIPREWKKKGTVEFPEREVWVYYYVTFNARERIDKKTPKSITNPDDIQKIHDNGGKIYKIELAPM